MSNDDARQYFQTKGLSYSNISELDIRRLANILEAELINYIASGDFHAGQMNMNVAPIRKKDLNFENGKLEAARIQIDGSYFKRREGITFNKTGFIGFAAEFSTVNTAPILKAFCRWCDSMAQ